MGAVAARTAGAGRVVYAALTVRRTAAIRIVSWFRGFLTLHLVSSVEVRGRRQTAIRAWFLGSKLPSRVLQSCWIFPFITLVRYERVFGGPAAAFLVESCGRTRGLVGDFLGPL
jgi:hypothetical protein